MVYLFLIFTLAFIILHSFFAASEISFISASMLKLRHRQEQGDKRAQSVFKLMSNPEKFLATILVGTNICVVCSASFFTYFLIRMHVANSNIWATVIMTPLVVLFAELVPKNIGRFFREDFSCFVVGFVRFFEKLFAPIVITIERLNRFLLQVILGKHRRRSVFVTKEEIRSLLREIERGGGLDRGETEAIEEVLTFKGDKIKDVCVPIKRVIAVDYTDSHQRITETITQAGFTRYPVFRNKEVIGYINIYDVFYNQDKNWQQFIRPVARVGVNQKLYEIFSRLKREKETMALVMKGKKVWGVITLQDLMREIVVSIVK